MSSYGSLKEAFTKDSKPFKRYLSERFPWIVVDFSGLKTFGLYRKAETTSNLLTGWDPTSYTQLDFSRMLLNEYLKASVPQEAWEQLLVLGVSLCRIRIARLEPNLDIALPKIEGLWKKLTAELREELLRGELFDYHQGYNSSFLSAKLLSSLELG